MREKLIELLDSITVRFRFDAWENTDKIADFLIANGATIPVRCKDCIFVGWRGTNSNDCGYFYCRHPSGLRAIKDVYTSSCDYGERRSKV